MAHGHAHEEADHAEHHSHDPFDKRVALSMVVIAALLAGVKLLGHRAHTETLRLRIEAGDLRTQADTAHTRAGVEKTQAAAASTKASNRWAFYQAKKLRQHFYEAIGQLARLVLQGGGSSSSGFYDTIVHMVLLADWKRTAERYAAETEEIKHQAEEFERQEKEFHEAAEKKDSEAEAKTQKSETVEKESEKVHHRTDRYDLGEMAVELGLVLCSVAILIKRNGFWYAGMASAGLGAVLAILGLLGI
jgi:hypothetical protein